MGECFCRTGAPDARCDGHVAGLCADGPTHQPYNLGGIDAVAERWPGLPQFACFDTAFYQSRPRLAKLYALPRVLSGEGILRDGFHGLSYAHIARTLPDMIGAERAAGQVLVAHLGSGASL